MQQGGNKNTKTEDEKEYKKGNTDFFFRKETYTDRPDILFSGGKYNV